MSDSSCFNRRRPCFKRRPSQVGLSILILEMVFSSIYVGGVAAASHHNERFGIRGASAAAQNNYVKTETLIKSSQHMKRIDEPYPSDTEFLQSTSIENFMLEGRPKQTRDVGNIPLGNYHAQQENPPGLSSMGIHRASNIDSEDSGERHPTQKSRSMDAANKIPSKTRHLETHNAVSAAPQEVEVNKYDQINTNKRPASRETSLWGTSSKPEDDDDEISYETEQSEEEASPEDEDRLLDDYIEIEGEETETETENEDNPPQASEDDFYGSEPELGTTLGTPEGTTPSSPPLPEDMTGEAIIPGTPPGTVTPIPVTGVIGAATPNPAGENMIDTNSQPNSELGASSEANMTENPIMGTVPSITETTLLSAAPGNESPNPTLQPEAPSETLEENENSPLAPSFDEAITTQLGEPGVGTPEGESIPTSSLPSTTTTVTTSPPIDETAEPEAPVKTITDAPGLPETTSEPTVSKNNESPENEEVDESPNENVSLTEQQQPPPEESMQELEKEEEEEKEKEEILQEELVREEREVRRIGGFGVFLAIVAMIFTAHQMSENPDGIYASCCRLIITLVSCGFKMVFMPFRSAVGGNRGYGHLPANTMDYGYRDPYRPGANNGGSMELS